MNSPTYGQTHEVTNQTPPLERYNALTTDPALVGAIQREGAAWHLDALTRDGLALTHPDVLALADLANRHAPEHHPFNARGERIDAIEFHPAWNTLLSMLREQGLHSLPFETATPKPGAMAARAAGYFLPAHLARGSTCARVQVGFFSAPQCDSHHVMPRTGESLQESGPISSFYVPRFAPDGSKNAVQVQQLKDKLGNRSNVSSEVEFLDAYGVMIGDEGRGVPTIIEMANFTRLDCVIGSAALMRAALIQAIHHARHRRGFGAKLIDQPLMRNVLADLALESEAATVLFMRLAGAFENSAQPEKRAGGGIVTPGAQCVV